MLFLHMYNSLHRVITVRWCKLRHPLFSKCLPVKTVILLSNSTIDLIITIEIEEMISMEEEAATIVILAIIIEEMTGIRGIAEITIEEMIVEAVAMTVMTVGDAVG
jgi:hypothetical protein